MSEHDGSIERICKDFTSQRQQKIVSLVEYAEAINNPDYGTDLFIELLQIDAKCRRAAGETVTPETYADIQQATASGVLPASLWPRLLEEIQGMDDDPRLRSTNIMESVSDGKGTQIGPYKLLQQIGEGGMGTVWMAEQVKPVRRMVALKIIKAGMDSKEVIARFEVERQALALMDHPNIAKVLDAGTTDKGLPYFVMELVKGVPITEYCDKNKLSPQLRLKLFVDVCRSVQHAHQRGIIHRDIKPSNVMVTLHDGTPVVKVIDFGLAKATSQKLTERTLFTAYGQMVGTPAYMSPEQAEMSGLDIDTRTDVYSLGVLLYELLTGTTPLDVKSLRKAGFAEMQRLIQEQEAPPMSMRLSSLGDSSIVIAGERSIDTKRLSQLLRGDLDVIVLKSIEKDRSRRYGSPNDFADDVQRFLSNEAIEARPASAAYRLKKLYHRNKVAVITTVVVAIAMVSATVLSTKLAIRATAAETLAQTRLGTVEQEQEKTKQALSRTQTAEAQQRQLREQAEASVLREKAAAEREKGLRTTAEAATQREEKQRIQAQQSERGAKWNLYVARLFPMKQAWEDRNFGRLEQLLQETTPTKGEPDFRGWEWYYFQDQVNAASTKIANDQIQGPVAWNPVENEFAHRNGQSIEIRNGSSFQPDRQIQTGITYSQLAWSPLGKYIAVADKAGLVAVFDGHSGQKYCSLSPFPKRKGKNSITGMTWSSDETQLAVSNVLGDIATVRIRDSAVTLVSTPINLVKKELCASISWQPNGNRIAASFRRGNRSTVNTESGEIIRAAPVSSYAGKVAWNPSGKLVATVETFRIQILDADMKHIRYLDGHQGTIHGLRWISDSILVSGGDDYTLRIWDTSTAECLRIHQVHSAPVQHFDVDYQGQRIISLSQSGVYVTAIAQDDRLLPIMLPYSSSGMLGKQEIDQTNNEGTELKIRTEIKWVQWSVDGRRIVATGWAPILGDMWGIGGIVSSQSMRLTNDFGKNSMFVGLSRSIQDDSFLIPTWIGKVGRFDIVTGASTIEFASQRSDLKNWSWTYDKTHAAFYDEIHRNLICMNWQTREQIAVKPHGWVRKLLWSPKSNRLATITAGKLQVFNSALEDHRMTPLSSSGLAITWHPNASLIGVGMENGDIQIFDAKSLAKVMTLVGHSSSVKQIAWSPDGRRIASVGLDGTARIWDAATGRELLDFKVQNVPSLTAVEWSPDGLQLCAGTGDGRLIVWGSDAMQPTPGNALTLETGIIATALQKLKGSNAAEPIDVPQLGWKTHTVDLRPLLKWQEQGVKRELLNSSFDDLVAGLAKAADPAKARRDFTTAMIHLIESQNSAQETEWLAGKLFALLKTETDANPDSMTAWRDTTEAHLVLANAESEASSALVHWKAAANSLTKQLEIDPDSQVAVRRLEVISMEHLDYDNASLLEILNRSIERAGEEATQAQYQRRAELHFKMGNDNAATADLERVIADFERAIALSNHHPRTIYYVTWHFLKEPVWERDFPKLLDRCVVWLQKAVEQLPESGHIRHSLGVAQYRTGDYEGAMKTLHKAYGILKGYDSKHFFFIAMCHWHLDQQDQAVQSLEKAITWMDENSPTDAELVQFRRESLLLFTDQAELETAWNLLDSQDWQGAFTTLQSIVASLKKSLAQKPNNLDTITLRAILRDIATIASRRMQNWEVATDAMLQSHELIRQQGGTPYLLEEHRLTLLLLETGRVEKRIEHALSMVESIDIDKDDARPMRIVVHSATTGPIPDSKLANRILKMALAAAKKDSSSSFTPLMLGRAQLRAGNYAKAIENCNRSISHESSTQSSMAFSCIAMAEFQQGHQDAALKALESARQALPPLPEPDGKTDLGQDWHDILNARGLLKEATSMIENQPQKTAQ